MSVIVYDKIKNQIAADRMGVSGDMAITATKLMLSPLGTYVVGWTGTHETGLYLLDWYVNGAHPDKWPKIQETEDWAKLVVADKKSCVVYTNLPHGQCVEDDYMGWGCGRDVAMGAMAMGADVLRAVEVASELCAGVGRGVTYFNLNALNDGQ